MEKEGDDGGKTIYKMYIICSFKNEPVIIFLSIEKRDFGF